MMPEMQYNLHPVGFIESSIKTRKDAPKQGVAGAPDVWLAIDADIAPALDGLSVGDEIIVITWLNQTQRDVLQVRPHSNPNNSLRGVFSTRSPDRPNPLGLHPVTIREIDGTRLKIGPMEAIDGTPVVDIKPAHK